MAGSSDSLGMKALTLLPPVLAALLVLPAGAAIAAEPADAGAGPVEVTAMVVGRDGRVTFDRERATTPARGRSLARQMGRRAGVVAAAVATPVRALGTPDPLREQQWGLTRLAAESVWAGGVATGQVVAVVDTGIDATHPDLAGAVRSGVDLVSRGRGDGTRDPNGHGTHVAGIVAALAGNGVGGAGLAQGAGLLPVRALDSTGSGYDSDVAEGLVWAVDHGADVANLSLGGEQPSALLTAAVEYALARGVTVVAAAGNMGGAGDPVLYPAATPGVLAVGATSSTDARPSFSSSGAHLSLAAPGVGILSTVPGGGHESWSGTSMAAPFVAAAVAVVAAGEPALSPAQLGDRLRATARDLGQPGRDRYFGAGLVDVLAARAAGQPASQPASEPSAAPASEPAAAPVSAADPAPAPAGEPGPQAPAPAPAAEPVTEPVTEPSSSPSPVAEPRVAEPVAEPAETPAPTIRTSRSAAVVPAFGAVHLASRVLQGDRPVAGEPVVLERRVGTGAWTALRSGTTSSDGLVGWTLRPDRSGEHRFRIGSTYSAPLPVDVRQVVVSSARRTGGTVVVDARVLPGGVASVVLQVPQGTGWRTVATATTDRAGVARFVRAVPAGTRLRVHVRARADLLPGTGAALRP